MKNNNIENASSLYDLKLNKDENIKYPRISFTFSIPKSFDKSTNPQINKDLKELFNTMEEIFYLEDHSFYFLNREKYLDLKKLNNLVAVYNHFKDILYFNGNYIKWKYNIIFNENFLLDRLLKTQEVCKILKTCPSTLKRLNFKTYKEGNGKLYLFSEVQEYKNKGR